MNVRKYACMFVSLYKCGGWCWTKDTFPYDLRVLLECSLKMRSGQSPRWIPQGYGALHPPNPCGIPNHLVKRSVDFSSPLKLIIRKSAWNFMSKHQPASIPGDTICHVESCNFKSAVHRHKWSVTWMHAKLSADGLSWFNNVSAAGDVFVHRWESYLTFWSFQVNTLSRY